MAGAPALSREAYASYRQKTIVGVNIVVTTRVGADFDNFNIAYAFLF